MSPLSIMETIKQEIGDAFKASGLTNAEFARRAKISEAMAVRVRDPFESCRLQTLDNALRALGKRIEVTVVALLIALAPVAAVAQLPYAPPPCTVTAHLVINTYIGPIEIDNVCMTTASYTGGQLYVEGIDLGDGIFRDGFDGDQP